VVLHLGLIVYGVAVHGNHLASVVPGAIGEARGMSHAVGPQTLPKPHQGIVMKSQQFASVWDAIEDTPEEAENMKLRSALLTALKDHITRAGMSQAQAARLLGVTQPRVSDLMRGKISLFGLDALVNMAAAAGLHIEMRILEAA
jgi:predicted XRE-type DNA-binding protein